MFGLKLGKKSKHQRDEYKVTVTVYKRNSGSQAILKSTNAKTMKTAHSH